MSSERKRSWDGDLDEDEILGTKKGKIEIDDEDALLLNDDEDDDLLRDSDTEDQKESIKSNGDSDKVELKPKVRHNSTKSISTNDETNFEDELDYDFSDDENDKKRERFTNERAEADVVVKKTPVHDSNKKEIPDTLEVPPEVEEKIAKFDEDKKKQRAKKFAPQSVKNGSVPKSVAPPVIRYGGPPPHIPAPMARMPPLHVTGPPPQLPGGKKILVNPKFRNKVNPTVSQSIPAIAPPIYRAPPPIYSAPPPGFNRPPFPPGVAPPHIPPSMVGVPPPMMPPRPFK